MKLLKTACAASVALMAGISMSQAVPTAAIRISTVATFPNNASTITIFDNGAGDNLAAVDGSISWSGVFGGYTLTVIGAQSKPQAGATAAQPVMDLAIQASTSGAAAPLYIEFSDIDWNPLPSGLFSSVTANNSGGEYLTYSVRVGANSLFASGTQIGSTIGPVVTGLYQQANAIPGSFTTSPYSITIANTISSDGAGTISTDSRLTTVPDGGTTLLLLGSALCGLAVFARSRKEAKV